MTDLFNSPLADVDPEVADAIGRELERQQRTLEMIASENFVPLSVLECQGSVLTNKYAEGYPGRRYYGGCEHVDVIEQLAIDRAKELFGAEHADVLTTTIHKTIGGGRGGMILCREDYAKKINSAVFPGQQGGPLDHVIAGKAVALKLAATDWFRQRQQRTVAGAKALAEELLQAGNGVNVLTGGTDVHLVLVDLRDSDIDGQQAEDRLHEIGITVNRNAVPFDPRPPMVTSGLRVGTPALATRGFGI